jgi:c-di-GMP-binding flagellar brake protein YcgR
MELSSTLRPGHNIEITVQQSDDSGNLHFKTVISRGFSNNQFTALAPVLHGTVYPLHLEDRIKVVFQTSETTLGLYEIHCKVIGREVDDELSLLTFEVLDAPVKIQRREAFRVKVFNSYDYLYLGVPHTLVTKDISFSGMLALADVKLSNGTTFEIEFNANTEEESVPEKIFKIRCRVLDTTHDPEIRRYLTRIVFESLSETETKYLVQYLYAKQSEILHAEPDYEKFIEKAFPKDRRRSNDPVMYRIQIIGFISVFISFIAFVLLLFSQPTPLYTLDLFFGYYRPAVWQTTYLVLTFVVLVLGIALGIVGLILNTTRLKRKNDSLNLGIVLSLIANSIMLIVSIYFVLAYELVIF